MPDLTLKLTKRTIDASAPGATRRVIWDSDLRGYGLRVEPSGTKTFIVRFRPKGVGRSGPKRFMTIGRYGPMTPDEARSAARAVLGRVALGQDPAEASRAAALAPTLAQLGERFVEEHIVAKKKASTAAQYRHYLRKLIIPALGPQKAASIRHADVIKLHAAIGKTRPITANRVAAMLSGVFAFGMKIGDVPEGKNPARGIQHFKERARQRYLSLAELQRLGDALIAAESEGLAYTINENGPHVRHAARPENRCRRLDPSAVAAIRLLLLTGGRLREILHARWSYLDTERGLLILPDSKTDEKTIYLGTAALSIIECLPRLDGNPFMFPGKGRRKPDGSIESAPRSDLKKPWAAVCEAAQLPGLRLHDLRHTFAAYGAGASLGLPMIGKLLGHSQPMTTQRYAHLDADPIHRAVNTIGTTITSAMSKSRME